MRSDNITVFVLYNDTAGKRRMLAPMGIVRIKCLLPSSESVFVLRLAGGPLCPV